MAKKKSRRVTRSRVLGKGTIHTAHEKTNITNPLKLSFGKRLKAFIELARIGNCIMAGIAILIGFFVATGFDIGVAIVAAVSGMLVCAAGQSINDYFDAKIDARTSKHRPIPSGKITLREAMLFSIGLFILGIALASQINVITFFIALLMSILLAAYPLYMNSVKFIGNALVALGTAITFVYGAAATGNIPVLIIALASTAFFANLAREITKDIEDVEKDKGTKNTLAIILGEFKAKGFVFIYYYLAVVVSIWIFFEFNLNYGYLLFAALGSITFINASWLLFKKHPKRSQRVSKLGMIASLLAFILAGLK